MTQQAHKQMFPASKYLNLDHSKRGNQCMTVSSFHDKSLNHKHLESDVSVLCGLSRPRPAPPWSLASESHSRSRVTALAAFQREDERNIQSRDVLLFVKINQTSRGGQTSLRNQVYQQKEFPMFSWSFHGEDRWWLVFNSRYVMWIIRRSIKMILLYHSLFVFHNSYMTWRHVPTLLGLAHRTVALVLSETVAITQYPITISHHSH